MSATYTEFRARCLDASLPTDVLLSLVASPYTFDAHHAFAADIAPHVIYTTAPGGFGYGTEWTDYPPDWLLLFSDEIVVSNGPYGAYTAGVTVVAVIVHGRTSADATQRPMLYLDSESFPGLPAVTLGGAIEVQPPTLVSLS
jgi:hypothetical protein